MADKERLRSVDEVREENIERRMEDASRYFAAGGVLGTTQISSS